MATKILVDCSNVAYRCFYTPVGQLDNGILFGCIRSFQLLEKMTTGTDLDITYCFDSRNQFRRAIDPSYKAQRAGERKDVEDKSSLDFNSMYRQVDDLHTLLHDFGCKVGKAEGLEADDIITNEALKASSGDLVMIVSQDKDMYQLLKENVKILRTDENNSYRIFTHLDLSFQYDCEPSQWADVRALSGDDSDNLPGIPGVGIKTAVKYLNGMMKSGKTKAKIEQFIDTWRHQMNRYLMHLPINHEPTIKALAFVEKQLEACEGILLKNIAPSQWNDMCLKYGLRSLVRQDATYETGAYERVEL